MALVAPLCWATDAAKDFTFAGTDYFHRWSREDQHEFTPQGQTDLAKWQDMLTLHRYTAATNAEQMAAVANAVLDNYKQQGAMILKVDASPARGSQPAVYFIAAVFPQPSFIEAVFTRLRLENGVGTGVIYSHRLYGKAIGESMSAWLKANAEARENELMDWQPPAKAFQRR
ncbi:hypothetical protein IB255_14165 [Pseudomonas sp. PDM22]|uniref:Uncharacterized protein n=1 Tax=Pseudomonas denitrificans TaxID=43306 RepID=A0A9X7N6V4_PSEDE|nr:hypothetical protein [Pseudomonas sp. PDM22]MBD9634356.1 hypothetical protein [Pseudomonas sp. PDM19]MBD9685875.1 hypothetical protein [Pseudomonas sp. PDM20]OQR32411.1 hypothetical protein BWR15_20155 [Pseudomonas sp. T]QEY76081.1 hypothetical protein F1C79_24380 [Pseudomonas denitrificans (nom. rej.)]